MVSSDPCCLRGQEWAASFLETSSFPCPAAPCRTRFVFWFPISREAVSLPADNHVAFLSHKMIENLPLFFDSVKNVGEASGFFSLGSCQKPCVPMGGDFELKTSNLFETSQQCCFCDCPLSNGTGKNESEAVQVAKLFLLPFSVFQVYPVLVSSSAHSGLAKVLSFEYIICFCFIPSFYVAMPVGQKMPFRLSGRRCLWMKQLA